MLASFLDFTIAFWLRGESCSNDEELIPTHLGNDTLSSRLGSSKQRNTNVNLSLFELPGAPFSAYILMGGAVMSEVGVDPPFDQVNVRFLT